MKSTDLVILKYLNFFVFLYNLFVITGFLIAFHFHMMLPIFSPNLGIAVLKSLQATFQIIIFFLLKYKYVLSRDEGFFFSTTFCQALTCRQL